MVALTPLFIGKDHGHLLNKSAQHSLWEYTQNCIHIYGTENFHTWPPAAWLWRKLRAIIAFAFLSSVVTKIWKWKQHFEFILAFASNLPIIFVLHVNVKLFHGLIQMQSWITENSKASSCPDHFQIEVGYHKLHPRDFGSRKRTPTNVLQWIQILSGVSLRQISREWLVGSTWGLQRWVRKIFHFSCLNV